MSDVLNLHGIILSNIYVEALFINSDGIFINYEIMF